MDPLQERARLEQQLRAATAAGQTVGAKLNALKEQRLEIDIERLRAYEALARGEVDARKRVDAAEKRRTTALADIERVTVELEGAKQARENVTGELARLLQDELATFADDAEEYTAGALEAFETLGEPLRKAQEAWREAQAAWQPLLPPCVLWCSASRRTKACGRRPTVWLKQPLWSASRCLTRCSWSPRLPAASLRRARPG